MPFQLPDPRVPIFPGINDAPVAPTASSAGNGADLIERHNLLVDIVNFTTNTEPEPINYLSLNEILTLTEYTAWYVDPVNGRDDNDGLSVDTAFLTLEKACAIAVGYFNPFRHRRCIQLAPGLYNYDEIHLPGHTNNYWLEGIEIIGSYENPENVVINSPIYHRNGGYYSISGVTFASDLNISKSILNIQKVQFTGEVSVHINLANYAKVEVVGGYSITGNATNSHIKIDTFSCVDFKGATDYEYCTINIADNVSFQNFVHLARNSYLSAKLAVFNGSPIGNKFLADGNSIIDTDGKDIDFFPGNTPGALTKNSYYF